MQRSVLMDFAVAEMEELERHARQLVCIYVMIGRSLLISFEFLGAALLRKNVYNHAERLVRCFLRWKSH